MVNVTIYSIHGSYGSWSKKGTSGRPESKRGSHCQHTLLIIAGSFHMRHLRVALFRRWWAIIAQTLVSECGLGTGQVREWPKKNPTNPGVVQRNAWPDHVISQLEPSVLGIHHEHREMITAGKSSVHRWIFHELILDTSHFHVTIGIPSGYLQ